MEINAWVDEQINEWPWKEFGLKNNCSHPCELVSSLLSSVHSCKTVVVEISPHTKRHWLKIMTTMIMRSFLCLSLHIDELMRKMFFFFLHCPFFNQFHVWWSDNQWRITQESTYCSLDFRSSPSAQMFGVES